MAWEQINKSRFAPNYKPDKWHKIPCIAVHKTNISFNKKFMEAFGLQVGDFLHLFVDVENDRVGFKKVENEERDYAHVVSGKNILCCKHIAKRFPFSIGGTFTARLNPGERVIEVNLSNGKV